MKGNQNWSAIDLGAARPETPELVREPFGHASFGLGPDQNWSARRTSVGGPRQGAMVAAVAQLKPGLHDVLCRSRSSGSFGLHMAVVEPSAKTLRNRV